MRDERASFRCVLFRSPASSPPTMSSATVRRAGCGMDSTISPTHLPSVAGRPASGRGSMISAGVWCNTRNMGAGRPAAPPHPFQTALTPPGLETLADLMELPIKPLQPVEDVAVRLVSLLVRLGDGRVRQQFVHVRSWRRDRLRPVAMDFVELVGEHVQRVRRAGFPTGAAPAVPPVVKPSDCGASICILPKIFRRLRHPPIPAGFPQ